MLKPLTEWISSSAELARLQAGIQQVSELDSALKAMLPNYLASHVYAPPIKDQALTIFAAHNALAARLRHLEPTVLATLQKRGFALLAIRIRVYPKARSPTRIESQRTQVSSTGVDCLRQLATVLKLSPLQGAINRIAQRYTRHHRSTNNIRFDWIRL
ncbi:DciA family protein [Candidatus Vallotia tarda]|uniref:DUF721 domain-containing protein n=1 Tax=Candidatus Vallotiella hemipterorum TaxID=1177213 RepID=A0A916JSG0_9BURK|nr:DciA family protein [Candidatus Vallotia tarda]CAG7599392.1 Putative uncharacterized protein [Candidatus Vallotia tarda]